jgi:universal stress protein A
MKTLRTPKATQSVKQKSNRQAVTIKTLLVPTDLSEPSMQALDYAIGLAGTFGATIRLVHVIEPLAAPEVAAYATLASEGEVRKSIREQINVLCQKHGLAETMSNLNIREGTPFHEILEAARTTKADAIVIATHGYTGLKHVLLGSTTERVVRGARCPVIVVPALKRR